jgi:hypothetical protein
LWLLLGLVLVIGPAAWVSDGQLPVSAAVAMYCLEAFVAVAGIVQYLKRRGGAGQ